MSTFGNQTVWHSAIAAQGRIKVMFTTYPRPSKWAGKPAYARFRVEGDGMEYILNMENTAVEHAIQALPLNAWVTVQFTGSRESANMSVFDAPPSPQPDQPTTTAQSQPQRTEPDDVVNRFWLALMAAREVEQTYEQMFDEPLSEATRMLATTLLIDWNRSGRPLRREEGDAE